MSRENEHLRAWCFLFLNRPRSATKFRVPANALFVSDLIILSVSMRAAINNLWRRHGNNINGSQFSVQ